jgi:hypothetical protein
MPKKPNSVQDQGGNEKFLRGPGNQEKWLYGESDNFSEVNPFKGPRAGSDVETMRARGRAAAAATFAAQKERQQSVHSGQDDE